VTEAADRSGAIVPRRRSVDRLLEDAQAIEAESAREADALGFMARVLVQATLPHSAQEGNEFTRSNGHLTVSILAPSEIGLPYGSYPRLLLTWLTTEAVRTKSRELVLGPSLSAFMAELGLLATGGRWGTVPRLKDQMLRLFSSMISATVELGAAEGPKGRRGRNVVVADDYTLWWDPQRPSQAALWQSTVKLSEPFFQQVVDRPVPIDMRAVKALKKSPLALDLYSWATYRVSYLARPTDIPWGALMLQFGAGYPDTAQGRRDFRKHFLGALRKVVAVYPALRAQDGERGLLLRPSPPHVPRL
jgi:hypothetical protein